MDTITLEQHFYSNAPMGIELSSGGWQTVAKSRGIRDSRPISDQCIYFRPDRSDVEPESWCWFMLGDDRVCLQRIGYTGLNREGNYLAQNLLVSAADLAEIDFDVTALMDWVARKQLFLKDHEEIYRKLGWDPGNLSSLPPQEHKRLAEYPPLKVPLSEVRQVRHEIDHHFLKGICEPLLNAKPAANFLPALLQACLCAPEQHRPILLYGIGNGGRPDTAKLVVDLLFALLPYHLRRALTFSTYAGDDQGTRWMKSHWDRKLMITTRWNTVRLPAPGQTAFPYWVINVENPERHLLPEMSAPAKEYISLLGAGKWEDLQKIRNFANGFDLPNGTVDLKRCLDLWRLQRAKSFTTQTYQAFGELAVSARPGRIELLNFSAALLLNSPPNHSDDLRIFEKLARGHLALIESQYPALDDGQKAEAREGIAASLDTLFARTIELNASSIQSELIEAVSTRKPYANFREKTFIAWITRLYEMLPDRLSPETLQQSVSPWVRLHNHCPNEYVECRQTLRMISGKFATKMAEIDRNIRPRYEPLLKTVVLPILQSAPLEQPQNLPSRLALLRDISPAKPTGSELIVALVHNESLTESVLASLHKIDPGMMLRYSSEFRTAAQDSHVHLVARYLNDIVLMHAFWSLPAEVIDPVVYQGITNCLGRLRKHSNLLNDLTEKCISEGAKLYQAALGPTTQTFTLEQFDRLAKIHDQIHEILKQAYQVTQSTKLGPWMIEYAINLVAMLLSCRLEREPTPNLIVECLRGPILFICTGRKDVKVKNRTSDILKIGEICARWAERVGTLDVKRFEALCNIFPAARIERTEGLWLYLLCLNVAQSKTDADTTRTNLAAHWLLSKPELISFDGHATEFQQYLVEDPAIWQNLGQKLLDECDSDEQNEAVLKWFGPDSNRAPLLRQLDRYKILQSIVDKLVPNVQLPGLRAMAQQVNLPAVAARARDELLKRRQDNIKACVESAKRTVLPHFEFDRELTLEVGSLADKLPVADIESYLDFLSIAALDWTADDFRSYAPQLAATFGQVASRMNRPVEAVWDRLLRKLDDQHEDSEFRACFIAIGEGLLWNATSFPAHLQYASSFSNLRKAVHLCGVFQEQNTQGQWDDALLLDLAKWPEYPAQRDWHRPVQVRAQLTALLYKLDNPGEKLGTVCIQLAGQIGDQEFTEVLAQVLVGYFTLDGVSEKHISQKLDQDNFWAALRNQLAGKKPNVQTTKQIFELSMQRLGLRKIPNIAEVIGTKGKNWFGR